MLRVKTNTLNVVLLNILVKNLKNLNLLHKKNKIDWKDKNLVIYNFNSIEVKLGLDFKERKSITFFGVPGAEYFTVLLGTGNNLFNQRVMNTICVKLNRYLSDTNDCLNDLARTIYGSCDLAKNSPRFKKTIPNLLAGKGSLPIPCGTVKLEALLNSDIRLFKENQYQIEFNVNLGIYLNKSFTVDIFFEDLDDYEIFRILFIKKLMD